MRKVLIANRNEIALRVLRACRELDLETVAVYSDADADALHVAAADEAVRIGGPKPADSYLNIEAIIAAARETGADAIHPGYGFLAENGRFAAACEAAGITFIGPSAEAIAAIGDKVAARRIAIEAGVPVVPGAELDDPGQAESAAAEIGYPLLVKAAAGGGGSGIRAVHEPVQLAPALAAAARQAEAAFGDSTLYLERLIEPARHVEVQVMGDATGNVVHFFERECSLQRRRQKLVEEAPSPGIGPETRERMTEAAVRLAAAVGYVNAGTVEFLVDSEERFYFIEMNTRLQVEHGVTELVTGLDLVQEQLRVAAGEPLSVAQEEISLNGSAIEFRINAEDPERNFLPAPGRIESLLVPGGPGVRLDTAITPDSEIVPFYDSLIAKLMVWAPTREAALQRGRRALDELRIEGVATTTGLHKRLLEDPRVVSGDIHTGYLEQFLETTLGGKAAA
jgi:acetyl-CoA carboxylase biotin carboxylase subunit